jgi:RHS repeat-associated protein
MLQGPKDQPRVAAELSGGQCVLPLAAAPASATTYSCDARTLPETRVWGSKPEKVHCSSATSRLKIELRWGCEECSGKTAVGSGVSFKYDPMGRRIYKSSSSGTSVYAYDGINLVEETNSGGTAVARYSQALNIDELLAMLRSGTVSYYQADGLGSVTSLSSAAGAIANTYDSFGNLVASSGSLVNSFRYSGREFDSESSLYYMRARYFDPATGRFLSEDPIGFGGGSNFYAYVGNSATNFRDPSGLDPSLWQRLINWLWPSPAPSTSSPKCPSPVPGYIPPWIPVKQFNKFNTGPSSGPYRPPSSPQAPQEPINPTEPPPVLEPAPPGGIGPEMTNPTPFIKPSPAPEIIPGFTKAAAIIEAIIDALGQISDPIIMVKPPCKDCS